MYPYSSQDPNAQQGPGAVPYPGQPAQSYSPQQLSGSTQYGSQLPYPYAQQPSAYPGQAPYPPQPGPYPGQMPPPYPQQQTYAPQSPNSYAPQIRLSNGRATNAMIYGIISLILSLLTFFTLIGSAGIITGIFAVVYGFIGLGVSKQTNDSGKPQALAGIVLGSIAVLLVLLSIVRRSAAGM